MVPLMNPATGSGRVRQWDHHRLPASVLRGMGLSNDVLEWAGREKAEDGQPSNRDDDPRANQSKLCLQPRRTGMLFVWGGHSIAPTVQVLPGKAAGHGRDIDPAAYRFFVESGAQKPTKELLPSSPGERPSPCCLDLAGRLPHQHHPRRYRGGQDRGDILGEAAPPTRNQSGTMFVERIIPRKGRRSVHSSNLLSGLGTLAGEPGPQMARSERIAGWRDPAILRRAPRMLPHRRRDAIPTVAELLRRGTSMDGTG